MGTLSHADQVNWDDFPDFLIEKLFSFDIISKFSSRSKGINKASKK